MSFYYFQLYTINKCNIIIKLFIYFQIIMLFKMFIIYLSDNALLQEQAIILL